MDERLQYSINVAQGLLSAAFPPMMLQTLVENAIKHGLEPKPDGGTLALGASIADGSLCVAVADSGLGLGAVDPAARPADAAGAAGTGVGLANVRDRLQALYGGKARLTVEANAGGGTIATIVLPYSVAAEQPAAPAA
jgi:sensor histidine kinase YesM